MKMALAIAVPIATLLAIVITLCVSDARARCDRLETEAGAAPAPAPAPAKAIPVETTPPVMFGDPWANDALDWADPVDLLFSPDCGTPDPNQPAPHLCYRCHKTNVPAWQLWCVHCRPLVVRTDVMDETRTAEL
ncbi:hypothetical protein [Kribbella deserti]|uniref:Uncharacterized protein n=1 Tax=Kribbella deserti TaxID=1926257 RepID=A0ABV6QPL7_9ACTN